MATPFSKWVEVKYIGTLVSNKTGAIILSMLILVATSRLVFPVWLYYDHNNNNDSTLCIADMDPVACLVLHTLFTCIVVGLWVQLFLQAIVNKLYVFVS